jgi:hypothetical protein
MAPESRHAPEGPNRSCEASQAEGDGVVERSSRRLVYVRVTNVSLQKGWCKSLTLRMLSDGRLMLGAGIQVGLGSIWALQKVLDLKRCIHVRDC